MQKKKSIVLFILAAIGLVVLPHILQQFGNAWVRIADTALLYCLLALGLNIVVGYAGLLDLGYVAFYAIGAYMYALLNSAQLTDNFPAIAAMFPGGLHTPLLVVIPLALGLAGVFGVLLGAPTLKLRGDYLAIVTLGFGEIIRVFMNTLDHPANITNGAKGIDGIDAVHFFGLNLGKPLRIGDYTVASVTLYYYLFLVFVIATLIISSR
ncbi:MAG: ABC transporter ATP-binding protein, partial [Comamonadaceae bacterium]